MINLKDSIRYTNVVSKNYAFHYNDMKEVLDEFGSEIKKLNLHKNGPLFYSMKNVPMDEIMSVELFMPVVEENITLPDTMYYHSYYSVENMMSTTVWKDYEQDTELAYSALLTLMNQSSLNQTTPMYHVIFSDDSFSYMQVKVGYEKKGEE
ncbi:DUF5085 family protein [Anaeromicropila herbilytica]|uniref:DUF5085 domain-containing protein n=1 Tax=Anaeromicropila herbilytica TaxID=2785025 RepID=A0A7R7ENQ5_9FIRM|nr:DUF5085 family protein [Anaeromicropila herbilytica]BCN31966.1 DUF5085 domain-containing protein [Anaeromicropila herbilytica]